MVPINRLGVSEEEEEEADVPESSVSTATGSRGRRARGTRTRNLAFTCLAGAMRCKVCMCHRVGRLSEPFVEWPAPVPPGGFRSRQQLFLRNASSSFARVRGREKTEPENEFLGAFPLHPSIISSPLFLFASPSFFLFAFFFAIFCSLAHAMVV